MKINHIINEFVTPQATAQDPGLEREHNVDVIFFGQMPRDFTADTVAEALEAVLPREYPPGSSDITNSNVYRVVTEIAKHQGAVVTNKPLSIAQKLVKTFQTYGIKCKIDSPGLEEGRHSRPPDIDDFDTPDDYEEALARWKSHQVDQDIDYENIIDEPDDWFDESRDKVGNMDADAFDDALARIKKLAGAGPLKTVYDPNKRVYKNVPHAVQPAQQPKKAR